MQSIVQSIRREDANEPLDNLRGSGQGLKAMIPHINLNFTSDRSNALRFLAKISEKEAERKGSTKYNRRPVWHRAAIGGS
jgi:hypothetical protein